VAEASTGDVAGKGVPAALPAPAPAPARPHARGARVGGPVTLLGVTWAERASVGRVALASKMARRPETSFVRPVDALSSGSISAMPTGAGVLGMRAWGGGV